MIAGVGWELDTLRLEAALMLPYVHPAQICFDGIQALADAPPDERGALMLRRLRDLERRVADADLVTLAPRRLEIRFASEADTLSLLRRRVLGILGPAQRQAA